MKDFKLIHLPKEEDHVINCISTVGKHLHIDDTGIYLGLLIEIIIEYLNEFPEEESRHLDIAQVKLEDARNRLERFFNDE